MPGHKMAQLPRHQQEKLLGEILTKQTSMYEVSKRFDVSDTAVGRWVKTFDEETKLRVVAAEVERARRAEVEAQANAITLFGEDVQKDMRWVLRELKTLLEEARADDDRFMALGSLKEIRQSIMSLAEIEGKLSKKIEVSVDVKHSPAFQDLKRVVMEVLENHPAAKQDFLAKLTGMKLIGASDAASERG